MRHAGLLMLFAAFTALQLVIFAGCATDKTDCKAQLKEISMLTDTMNILDYGDYEVLMPPSTYCPGDYIRYIFAVPQENTVGTNELNNAVTLLRFKDDRELEQEVVKKDFMEMVTGPFEFRFLPVWSADEIGYSQSKGFVLVNLREKEVGIQTISPGMYGGEIEKVLPLNPEKRTFVFEILESSGNQEGDIWDNKSLKIIRFEKDTFTIVAQRPAGKKTSTYTEPWFVYQEKIFIYDDTHTKLAVFDEEFNPVAHPLADIFNKSSDSFRQMYEIVTHPSLPFALIVETGKDTIDWDYLESLPAETYKKVSEPMLEECARRTLYLFKWDEPDSEKRFVPLLSVAGSIWGGYNPENNYGEFEFSPDGNWCIFRDYTGNFKNPVFVALPIDEKNPLYVGKPIKLGNALREDAIGPTATAWTTDPVAFVMCDGKVLYRWNLSRYGSVGKTKMPPGSPDPLLTK